MDAEPHSEQAEFSGRTISNLPTIPPLEEPVREEPVRDDEDAGVRAHRESLVARLTALFGEGAAWSGPDVEPTTTWTPPAFDLLWRDGGRDIELRRVWVARKGSGARPVVLLAPADDESRLRVYGPQHPRPVRELPAERVFALLERAASLHFNEAASMLAREFIRLEEAALPGLRVKELLTIHFVRQRLATSLSQLEDATRGVTAATARNWRPLFEGLGYAIEQLPKRGHLLRVPGGPAVAVLHILTDADSFGRLTMDGALPEGMLLAACDEHSTGWGVLASGGRYRLFQRWPASGAAGGQYIEIDADELEPDSRFCLGLLSPESLSRDGWLAGWAREARDFGERLREGLKERLVDEVLPSLARGLGEYLESQGEDPGEPEQLRQISEAALTLVFRFMFLLHVEARGYLPVNANAYRPHSATRLAEEARDAGARGDPSSKSTRYWDQLRTLVRMIRSGDEDAGVPAYNGQLFAADRFPGSELLEQASITNARLAPALAAIAYETDRAGEPGLDYAGLQIGHLGAIYEALLSLRLTRAPEDLAYEAKPDIYRPVRAGEDPAVTRRELYYQSEAGGRKAGGVFYTRHEFVRHLLRHSLEPALAAHLEQVRKTLDENPEEAAQLLFNFSVLDPAMGSAHFLTAALDVMADRYAVFLAEVAGIPGVKEQLDQLRRGDLPGVRQPEDGDLLRRLILKRCIYGVDVSPMAVEVANVTLWLASFVPGLALSWLDGNLKCGDALIGVADLDIVGKGRQPRRRGPETLRLGRSATAPRTAATLLAGAPVQDAMQRAATIQHDIASIPDRTPEEVGRSEARAADLREVTDGLRAVFDLWTAEPLGVDGTRDVLQAATADLLAAVQDLPEAVREALAASREVAADYRFFHWPLEFPGIFHGEGAGFDVVVGNPPWRKVRFERQKFLALQDPGIHGIKDIRERDARAEVILRRSPDLREQMEHEQRRDALQRKFFRPENGYAIQGRGDTDLYKLFCERYASLARREGYIGVVLPRVAFLNDGSRGFRQWLFSECRPNRIDALVNNRQWAFPIHPQFQVALLTAAVRVPAEGSLIVTGPARNEAEFRAAAAGDGVEVDLSGLAHRTTSQEGGSPETSWELPLFPTQQHADITKKLHAGVRFDQIANPESHKSSTEPSGPTRVTPYRELDESGQKALFSHPPGSGRVPVWKGRSFSQYDPHGRDPVGHGSWGEILDFVQSKRQRGRVFKAIFPADVIIDPSTHPVHDSRIAFHDVARSTDSRTVIACLTPPRTPLTDKAPYLIFSGWRPVAQAAVLGVMNSLPFDWLARRYVETGVKYFILNMLCFPRWDNVDWERIGSLAARLSCIDDRFAEFAAEAEVECGPLSDAARATMRAEIDAHVARGYELTTDELRCIFTDFTENAVSPVYRDRVLRTFEGLK